MTNFLKSYDIKGHFFNAYRNWLGYFKKFVKSRHYVGTLNCTSTDFKKIREMKVVICTRDSTKVLKASLSLIRFPNWQLHWNSKVWGQSVNIIEKSDLWWNSIWDKSLNILPRFRSELHDWKSVEGLEFVKFWLLQCRIP